MPEKKRVNKVSLSELIDLDFLQEFQDVFAKAMNVASITVDSEGPITKPSNFTDFCIKHTRGSKLGFQRCNECDITGGELAVETGKPAIYACHAGLTDFAVPIIVKGEHVGSILCGQILTGLPDEEHYRKIAKELGINEDAYIDALRDIKIVPFESIKMAADLLSIVANSISEISLKNFELIKKTELDNVYKRITETIRSSLDIDKTLKFICEEAAKLLKVQRATIVQFPTPENYENYKVRTEYKINLDVKGLTSSEYVRKAAAYWGYNLGTKGDILAFDNIQESDTPDYFRKCYGALGVKSMIGLPIKKGNVQWGSLVLSEYNNYRQWTDNEKNLLEIISDQIYIAINQAELYETVQRSAENERVLRKIMLSTVNTFDGKKVIETIVTETGKLFKSDRCIFVKYNSEQNADNAIKDYAEYLSSKSIKSHLTSLPNKACSIRIIELLKQRNTMIVDNVEEAEIPDSTRKMLVDDLSVKSYLIAPVYYGDIDYGAIIFHYVNEFKSFAPEDVAVAQAIASQSATVIHQANLYSTIEKNEKYTRTIFDSIKDGIIIINEAFNIESSNPSIEKIWGYCTTEIIGKKLDFILNYDCTEKNKKDCLSAKGIYGIKKNGDKFPVEIDVSEINLEDKKLTLLVIRDITERKKIDKMKNEFVSTVSHELRTPLTAIKGALGLVTSGALGSLPEKANEMINIANTNCTRLTNLINDILDLEKIKAGKYEFKYEELNINEIVKQSIVLNQPYAEQFGMRLKATKYNDEAFVKADKNRLLQVLSNLISNAVKFSKLNGEVTVAIEKEGDNINISVQDKGIGIADEAKHKIFQSFSQVDSSDTRSKGGTGLGLSISKLIIESMGGKIGFTSAVGQGSNFFFTMPTIEEGSLNLAKEGELKELDTAQDAW